MFCGSGGFFSLSQYCINGISGRGCGRSHQRVLQLATPGGVLGVFLLFFSVGDPYAWQEMQMLEQLLPWALRLRGVWRS